MKSRGVGNINDLVGFVPAKHSGAVLLRHDADDQEGTTANGDLLAEGLGVGEELFDDFSSQNADPPGGVLLSLVEETPLLDLQVLNHRKFVADSGDTGVHDRLSPVLEGELFRKDSQVGG